MTREHTGVFTCDVCKKQCDGAPHGGVNTADGQKVVCSPECFLKALPAAVTEREMLQKKGN